MGGRAVDPAMAKRIRELAKDNTFHHTGKILNLDARTIKKWAEKKQDG